MFAGAEQAFRHYLSRQMNHPEFANARSELERARLRHAHRLASDPHRHWTRDDLMRIEPADIHTGHGDLEALPGGRPGSLGRGA
jgi:AAA lid domain